MKTTKEMKSAIEEMLRLYEESDRLFLEDEDESDRLYKEGYSIEQELVRTLVKVSHGLIDQKTVRTMVLKMPDRLIEICNKF
jgi:hypothetical protein